ncbi:MAG TPA: hypothetical protein VMH88_08055 [Gemmatimonadales bacterium]|nr:hypothetical protein [Gemmatimonadales bacterium]
MNHLRRYLASLACIAGVAQFAAIPVAAQADSDKAVAGGGTIPAPWHAHTDGNAPLTNVKFTVMNPGQHVTLGPAAIFWRDADTASGSYTVEAKFWQFAAPHHREGYGLILGGRDLAGAGQRYTYFIIAGTGEFLVKRRNGESTSNVTSGWQANAAVVKQDTAGKAENTLTVRVSAGKVSFLVNGKEVYSGNSADLDVAGVFGYRVNHNLNVHLGPIAKR